MAVAALAVLTMPAVVLGFETAASASTAITSVVVSGTQAAPQITVNGSGFGASVAALGSPQGIPADCGGGNTGSDYADNFKFKDLSAPWEAGRGTDQPGDNCIGVLFTSYSDTQVVFTLGSNYHTAAYLLNAGDAFTMTVLGTVYAGHAASIVPANIPPAGPTITSGQRAAWSFSIVNPYASPMTGVTASLHAFTNGSTPQDFDTTDMPSCSVSGGNTTLCNLPDIPAHSAQAFNAFVAGGALPVGTTFSGDVTVSTNITANASGTLGTVTIAGCGSACVQGAATPGDPIASSPGAATDAKPTKQIVTLPDVVGGPPVAVTLTSLNPGPSTSASDKQLCPVSGSKCSGQISVIGGDFRKYNDRAHPIRIQIVMKWTKKIPPGRMMMSKLVGPPIQLPTCVKKNGLYNTPCAKPEVVTGSLATHNLVTSDVVLFVGTDPHVGRRASNLPDAPTLIKATAGKKSATVTWKAPIVTNGPLTGYLVTPHLGKVAKTPVNVTGTKKAVTGLVSGRTYTFTVQAKNRHGISFASIASKPVKVK